MLNSSFEGEMDNAICFLSRLQQSVNTQQKIWLKASLIGICKLFASHDNSYCCYNNKVYNEDIYRFSQLKVINFSNLI